MKVTNINNINNIKNINPWYVVGLVEGEGCFSLAINKRPDLKIGWDHRPLFSVALDCKVQI